MSDTPKKLDPKSLLANLDDVTDGLRRYTGLTFVAFVVLLYGFVMFRISSLSNARPSDDAVSSQVQAARIPRIDPAVVHQLQSLQDNSVNVKSLFDQARSNPFQ